MGKLEDTISLHKLVYVAVKHLIWVIAQATESGTSREAVWQDQWERTVAEEHPIFTDDLPDE